MSRDRGRRESETGSGDDAGDAAIVSIGALTREATWRRLAELARRTDPPPPAVTEAAMALAGSSAWHSIDDELAALVYDSDADDRLLENVRALHPSGRLLTFRAPHLVLEVEVTRSRPREIVCQVVPPQPSSIEVRLGHAETTTETDQFGTFHLAAVSPGPLSLRCVPLAEDAAPVATSWFRI
jgi:hypothetical protein